MRELNIGEPFLSDLGRNLDAIEEKVDDIGALLDDTEVEAAAQKAAYSIARSELLFSEEGSGDESIATQVLVEVAMAACIDTKEYDYDLFMKKLSGAIINNFEMLFTTRNADESVSIDLSGLGNTEQWVDIAHEAYDAGSRGWTHVASGEDMAARLWREKLYKPAREGIAPPEKAKKAKKTVSSDTDKLLDELEKGFPGEKKKDKIAEAKVKYRETIQNRLNKLDIDEAPFWELIDNGNTAFDEVAYPVFGATNFVNEAERILSMLFRESINIYVPKIENELYKLMIKEVDLRAGEKLYDDEASFREDAAEILKEELEELMEGGRALPRDRKTATVIWTIETTFEAIVINEQSHLRGRNPVTGQFKSLVLGD
jgi:hypothetical protein